MAAPLVETADVLILGAGPAGLSAAAGLARLLHTVVVFSTTWFRNERARHMHSVPGWDHRDPAAFRAATREQILARYDTVRFEDREIVRVAKIAEGDVGDGKSSSRPLFEAVGADGARFRGRRVVVASGVRDVMPPDIPGFAELWGYSIWPLATGPMANPMMAPVVARMAARLADQVTIYTNGNAEFGAEMRKLLKSIKKYRIDNRKIVSLARDSGSTPAATPFSTTTPATCEQDNASAGHGLLVTLADGTVAREAFLAHAPATQQASPFAAQLGLELEPQGGFIKVAAPFPATSVEGVYAAGDCATFLKSVPTAVYMGATAAGGVVHSLGAEDDVGEEGERTV